MVFFQFEIPSCTDTPRGYNIGEKHMPKGKKYLDDRFPNNAYPKTPLTIAIPSPTTGSGFQTVGQNAQNSLTTGRRIQLQNPNSHIIP